MGEADLDPTSQAEPTGEPVDAAALSAMMAQMQALMSEVSELRAKIAAQPMPSEPDEDDDDLAARFARALKESEESDDEEDESVSAEETAELLAGVESVFASDFLDGDDDVKPRSVFYVESIEPEAEQDDDLSETTMPVALNVVAGGKERSEVVEPLDGVDLGEMSDADLASLILEAEEVAKSPDDLLGEAGLTIEPLIENEGLEDVGRDGVLEETVDFSEEPVADVLSQAMPVEDVKADMSFFDSAPDTTSDGVASYEWDDEMPSEAELAELIRGRIQEQNEEDEGASETNETDAAVLSAEELAAMLEQPDLDPTVIPGQSEAMDDDELARLLIEAQSQDLDGVETGSTFGQNPPKEKAGADQAKPQAGGRTEAAVIEPSGEIDLGAIKAVPAHLAVRALAVPIRFLDGKLVCHVAEPIDRPALDKISKATGFGVVAVVKPIDQVLIELRSAYSEVRDDHARWAIRASSETKPSIVDTFKSVLRRIA